ncbi:MAG: hypothetical protein ACRDVE_10135 [Actinocrinis sp.]
MGWWIAALLLTGVAFGFCIGFCASVLRGGQLAFEYADWLVTTRDADTDEQWLAQEKADLAAVVGAIEARDGLAAFANGVDSSGTLRDRVRTLYAACDVLRERFADRLMQAGRYIKDEDDDKQPGRVENQPAADERTQDSAPVEAGA